MQNRLTFTLGARRRPTGGPTVHKFHRTCHLEMDDTRIPIGAIERRDLARGGFGRVDLRKHAIREVVRFLAHPSDSRPEVTLIASRVNLLGERIEQQLWLLYDILAAREHFHDHIREQWEQAQERLVTIPEFAYDEGRSTARGRYGLEQLQADLMKELRDAERKWLERRGDIETAVGELLGEYAELLAKLELLTGSRRECPTLNTLFHFLKLPRPSEVLIIDQPEEVKPPSRRMP
jgi:hypothetical protein